MYEAQTVDPVKHGHWIEVDTQYIDVTKCSNCGVVEYFNKGWKRFNYCPNCGAKMDEVEVKNSKGIELWMTEEQFNSIYEMEEVEDEL